MAVAIDRSMRPAALALLALVTGFIALLVDRFLAIPLYPDVHLFFGSFPIFLLALVGGPAPALLAAVVSGLGSYATWGHPQAWAAVAIEALAVGYWGRRGHAVTAVLGFWLLVGLPLFAVLGVRPVEGGALGYIALTLKSPLQDLFCVLLARNVLYLPPIRALMRPWGGLLQVPKVSLQLFQLSFVMLLLLATAGTVMIVQARAVERDERAAIGRLNQATATLASAELSTTLQGYATTLAVAGGLWPGLSPAARTERAKDALERGHFQLFAWLDRDMRVQGGWLAADGGRAARPATPRDFEVRRPFDAAPGEHYMLVVTPGHTRKQPALLVLYELPGNAGYLAGGVNMVTISNIMASRLPGDEMTLELRDRNGVTLASASVTRPRDSDSPFPGVPMPRGDLQAIAEVPHTAWKLAARTPEWVLHERVNTTLWHALPPLLLLLAVLGAMGTGTMMLLRQELRQITKSTVQLGRLATEGSVEEPTFEDSFLVEVEALNEVYRTVASSLARGFQDLRRRDAELSLANTQLGALVDTLKAIERNRAEVMNAISHDIKIPLTAVIGYTELLEDLTAGPLTNDQREYVRNIGENSQRVVHLLEDLLDFARLEVGRFPIDATEVDVAPALARTLRNLQPLIDAQGLVAEIDVASELTQVQADPHRLDQVLNNLLSNAIKFTPSGGRIWLRAMPGKDGNEALIQVVDTGIGIAEEHLPRLFERFYRVPGSKAPGTGLGLAISRKLVEAMGGHMGVLSEPGKGSTFWFTLPLTKARTDEPSGPRGATPEVPGLT